MTRKIKLKTALNKHILDANWTSKLEGLSRPKWDSLKRLARKSSHNLSFFNQERKISQSKLIRIKSLFLARRDLISLSKVTLGKLRTKQLRCILLHYKNTGFLKRTDFLINAFERRICVIMTRARLFPTILQSLNALQRGDVFVNNKPIRSFNYLLATGDILSIKSATRRTLRDRLDKLDSTLTLNKPTSGLGARGTGDRKIRLNRFISSLSVRRNTLATTLEKWAKIKNHSSRISSHPLPAHVPTYLIVDFVGLSVCLKSTISQAALSVSCKQPLRITELWRL